MVKAPLSSPTNEVENLRKTIKNKEITRSIEYNFLFRFIKSPLRKNEQKNKKNTTGRN
jgi:hypothetical protein